MADEVMSLQRKRPAPDKPYQFVRIARRRGKIVVTLVWERINPSGQPFERTEDMPLDIGDAEQLSNLIRAAVKHEKQAQGKATA